MNVLINTTDNNATLYNPDGTTNKTVNLDGLDSWYIGFRSLAYTSTGFGAPNILMNIYNFSVLYADYLDINNPIVNTEYINNYSVILNTSQEVYNDTVWYSWNNGLTNTTLCTNSAECESVATAPGAGVYDLTVWVNNSIGLIDKDVVGNLQFNALNITSNRDMCGSYNYIKNLTISDSAIVTICDYNGVGENGTLKFDNLTTFNMLDGFINSTAKGQLGGVSGDIHGKGSGGGIGHAGSGGGGAYGGDGGDNNIHGAGGSSYGSTSMVLEVGSGGGSGSTSDGGDGGGYVRINATGIVEINGSIIADGELGKIRLCRKCN